MGILPFELLYGRNQDPSEAYYTIFVGGINKVTVCVKYEKLIELVQENMSRVQNYIHGKRCVQTIYLIHVHV